MKGLYLYYVLFTVEGEGYETWESCEGGAPTVGALLGSCPMASRVECGGRAQAGQRRAMGDVAARASGRVARVPTGLWGGVVAGTPT